MVFNKRVKSSERFVNPALIDESDESFSITSTPSIPERQITYEVPEFLAPGFILLGRMYVDAYLTLKHMGLSGLTVEQIETALDQMHERLEDLDEKWMDRRDKLRQELNSLSGSDHARRAELINLLASENIPKTSEEDIGTPHQDRFGGVLKLQPYGRGLMPLTIYMSYRQLVAFIEVMDVYYNLEKDWKEQLRRTFNDAVPFYGMMDKIASMLRSVPNQALVKSDFTRAFPSQDHGVVELALRRLVELGICQVTKTQEGLRGRPGLIYFMNR